MCNFIRGFFSIILITFIVGPSLSISYYFSIKSNSVSTSLQSYGFIIAVGIGLLDSVCYGMGLYVSIQTVNESDDERMMIDYSKYFRSILAKEKQLLQPISETVDVIMRTQVDLHNLMKDLIVNNTTDHVLMENAVNKLTTLDFIQTDGLMTIKKHIRKSLRLLKLNSSMNKNSFHGYFNPSIVPSANIFSRIHQYIFTCSFLLFIHQLVLWVFQYLYSKNPQKYRTYPLILCIFILSQSLGLIYFLHITNTLPFSSPIYIYTCIFFIRSLTSLYHHTFSDC